jgi:ADP-ribose pyrophosphatase YjhB (NUDIX family)
VTLRTPTASDTVAGGIRPERDWERALAVRPSASAVIFDRRGRVLLQQRSDGGQWGLPGGSVEIGESVTDAVIREVREETGLIVTVRRLVGVYSDPARQVVRYPDGNVWHYVNVCFECVVRGGTLTTCDETLSLRYVSPTRLPRTLLPNHRIRIRDACSRRAAAFVR